MALVGLCGLYLLLADLAVNIGYHRVLAHRSLVLTPWFEHIVVTLGLPAGTPIQWAGNHRYHHANADQPGDPHSPLDGFWHAHVGWYISTKNVALCFLYALAGPLRTLFDGWHRPRSNQEHNGWAPDVAKDAYYRWVSRPGPYLSFAILHVVLWYGVAAWIGGLSAVFVLWAMALYVYNIGDAIDSVAHIFGKCPYPASHRARNHWIMGWFALGEGWHANHHQFPQSARHGLLPGQFDWTFQMILFLAWLGLARNIYVPTKSEIEGYRIPREVLDG